MQNSTFINFLPCSKSYANRALVYSFVQNLDLKLENLSNSDDVRNTQLAVKSYLNGSNEIHLGEGGTTIRFMLCALATFDRKIKVLVHPRFKERPIQELFNIHQAVRSSCGSQRCCCCRYGQL